MPKPSEIFDTPAATGFSRVEGNEEQAEKYAREFCRKTPRIKQESGVVFYERLNATIFNILTTKDQEREEDGKKSYEDGVKQTIAQFLRMNLENPKAPVNIDEVKRRALTERH